MDAEIIAIGSELLLGSTIDTNSAYLASQLAAHGVNVYRKAIIGDNTGRIAAAVSEALERADLVLCTGGLGPTVDDVTREGVAQAFGRELEFRQELLDQIAARFAAFKRTMSESNRRQAYVPEGARAIENPRGTAPAFLMEDERGAVIVLPGVPNEMRFLFKNFVLPYLRDERGIRDVIVVRTLYATGKGESVIGEQIADLMQAANPTVGISAKQARYELRIGAKAESAEAAEALIAPVEATLHERLGADLLGDEPLDEQIARLMHEQNQTLALFEGNIAAPVYYALRRGSTLPPYLRGVTIHPSDEPTDERAADVLAHSGAVHAHNRWRTTLALGLQAVNQPDESGATTVCVVLVSSGDPIRRTFRYDLHQTEGWEVIGSLTLDMLRRTLLREELA
jgi:competence/damage-inducible protein CinA-like protein